jgi:zinc protease
MKKITKWMIGCVMVLAQKEALGSTALNVQFPVEKMVLSNGLTVLLYSDRSIPMVSYHTWYRVGSRDETPGVTGAAHMLEHMMFKGAKKYSGKEFDKILHQNGITNNAFTSWDYTGFYQNLPSHRLELMMDMEVDRMRFLKIDEADLKSELQVVSEERRWRVDNNPSGLLRESLFSKIFVGTPYQWPVIGTMKDILSYNPESLRFFYDTYYVPNNAVLVLAGDFDLSQVKKMLEKHYGVLPEKPLKKREYPKMADISKPVRSILKKDVQTIQFIMSYPSVTVHEEDVFALEVLGSVLGEGASSRLSTRIVHKEQVATGVSAFQLSNEASGFFGISVSLKSGESLDKAELIVREEIKKLLSKGVEDVELLKAKNRVMKDFVESLMTLDGKARALASNEILFGSYQRLFSDLDRYQKVTKEEVWSAAKRYLNSKKEIFVALVPNHL